MDINTTKEKQKYKEAKARVAEEKAFYQNLTSYTIIISLLGGLNYYIDGWKHPWFLWAAFGWGIGVTFHALRTFRINPMFNKEWEERKIQKYMEEDDKNKQLWE